MLVESIRQKLNRRPLFNINDAFKAIDRYHPGFITHRDLKGLLEESGIFVNNNNINFLGDLRQDKEEKNGTNSRFSKEISHKSYLIC